MTRTHAALPVLNTVYDLEPQKLTGIIKFIGKVDSEFIDNRVYVGLKLDEPGEFFFFRKSDTAIFPQRELSVQT